MKYLLDTHTLLWFLTDDENLSRRTRQLIESSSHESVFSVASLCEIAIKAGLRKLDLDKPIDRLIIAQGLPERLPIISVDKEIDAYGVDREW